MAFLYLKAIHIIFIVTWFAGLFYLPRLFIYQTEAYEKPEPEKSILSHACRLGYADHSALCHQMKRVFGTTPAAVRAALNPWKNRLRESSWNVPGCSFS